ncbi:MAG: SulP family inorganic anion transporter, partial [Nitrospirae bacterium]|nr:SulP family inorganic anion transporter [Nitrospirota bacterium]
MPGQIAPPLDRVLPFLPYLRSYTVGGLKLDLVAGLTVAIVALPQSMAYALIAGIDPRYGLYASIVPAILGSLFGSSRHLITGPTNAISLVVLSTLAPHADDPARMISLVFLLAMLVGGLQLFFGLVRMGGLINFVSHSVILGFMAGAGVLIAFNQIKNLLGISIPRSHAFVTTTWQTIFHAGETNVISLGLGALTILLIVVFQRKFPKLPAALMAMGISGAVVYIFDLASLGVRVVGEIPRTLPPISLPAFDLESIRKMAPGALAVSLLGAVEALSIARAISSSSKQKIDGNQEFIGQGLSNIGAAFFSGYPGSGSFTRSAVNFKAGGETPLAGAFSGLFVLFALLAFAPMAAYIPIPALAGLLMIVAYSMVDRQQLALAYKATRTDRRVLISTGVATLLLDLEFAVLLGVLISIVLFLRKVSAPRVMNLIPNGRMKLRELESCEEMCPQMMIAQTEGGLFFGSVSGFEEALEHATRCHGTKVLNLRMKAVSMIDATGVHALELMWEQLRSDGRELYLSGVSPDVRRVLAWSGFDKKIGEDHILSSTHEAVLVFFRKHVN